MKPHVQSAAWAGVITAISAGGALLFWVAGAPPWLAFLTWPSFPGYVLAFFLDLGAGGHGIPAPTDIAPYVLTFAVWWVVVHVGLTRWRRRRARAQWLRSPLP
jgi:hypothetical protein